MTELLSSLSSWFHFFLTVIVGGDSSIGTVTGQKTSLIGRLFENYWTTSSDIYQKAVSVNAFMILFIVAPVVVFAAVGIWHRLLRKN